MGREEAWTGRSEDLGSNSDPLGLSGLPKKGKNEGLGPQGLSLRGFPTPEELPLASRTTKQGSREVAPDWPCSQASGLGWSPDQSS